MTSEKLVFLFQMSACGLISHASGNRSPEFTVELWMVIAAPQRLVWKDASCRFPTLQIHLGHWGPVGIVLRLWILIFHGHFAKTLSEASSLLPAPLTAVTEFLGSVGTPWVGSQEVLGSCGSFVTAVGRRGTSKLLSDGVVPGHTCWHCGFWEVQTSECDDLCCSSSPSPLCSLIQNQQEAGSPHLSGAGSAQVAASAWRSPCPLPGGSGIRSPLALPQKCISRSVEAGIITPVWGIVRGDRAFLVPPAE